MCDTETLNIPVEQVQLDDYYQHSGGEREVLGVIFEDYERRYALVGEDREVAEELARRVVPELTE